MKILFVASGNHASTAPFVTEQAAALRKAGNDVFLFTIEGHGIRGYLKNLKPLKDIIIQFRPDVVHAHYGLCGLLCTLQHLTPVVITYHGSDINDQHVLPFSRLAMHRAAYNIFVSNRLKEKSGHPKHSLMLPCGVDTEIFYPMDQVESRIKLNLPMNNRLVLFAGAFDNPVKNYTLAKEACGLIPHTQLIELKGYSRQETAQLMNACDSLLMTSLHEGSPQVVKEALAVGLPIVSVDVGDVKEILVNTEYGNVVQPSAQAIANALAPWLDHPQRTNGPKYIRSLKLDIPSIVSQLNNIYSSIIKPA